MQELISKRFNPTFVIIQTLNPFKFHSNLFEINTFIFLDTDTRAAFSLFYIQITGWFIKHQSNLLSLVIVQSGSLSPFWVT